MVCWKRPRGSWRLAEWGRLPPRQLVHRRTHEVFRRQHLRFMDAGEFPARNFPVCARTRPGTRTSLSMADTRCAGILEETEKQQKAFHRKIKLSQRIEGKGPDSPTPLSPRLASDAPSSTAILPPRRIGACPSTSSPRRTSSTTSSPTPSAKIRSSAGAPRCLAPARRVTGSTVPGASSRATAPTPSPPPLKRRSTSATASASAPASGARRAASGRALRLGLHASSSTHPRQTPGCSSPTEGSNGARRCRRRPRRSAAIDASSAWTRSPSTGSSAGEPPVECASTLIRPEF